VKELKIYFLEIFHIQLSLDRAWIFVMYTKCKCKCIPVR